MPDPLSTSNQTTSQSDAVDERVWLLEPSEALRRELDYFAYGGNTRPVLERLAGERPSTLACMHGSAWSGDGAALLRVLADSLRTCNCCASWERSPALGTKHQGDYAVGPRAGGAAPGEDAAMKYTPFRPSTILAAVAEGALSDHAVAASVDLCNRLGARLELVHAVPMPLLPGTRFDRAKSAAVSAERVSRARDDVLAHLERAHRGLTVDSKPLGELLRVIAGPPAKVVLDRLRDLKADLLVIGDSGKSKNMDFGGVAAVLLGKAPCPIWMQTARLVGIERVLAPVDLSEHSLAALSAAVDVAERYGGEVTALHCFAAADYALATTPDGGGYFGMPAIQEIRDTRREHFEEQMASFDWRGVQHRNVFGDEDPVRGILRRQEEHDLVVMGTHGRTGLTAAVLGGVAYRVMRSAYRPVLAIRQPDRPWQL